MNPLPRFCRLLLLLLAALPFTAQAQWFLELKGHAGTVNAVLYSPKADFLFTAGADGLVLMRDAETGAVLQEFKGHKGGVNSLAIHPDGHLLASAGQDGTVHLWDLKGGYLTDVWRDASAAIEAIEWNASGTALAITGYDRMLRLWNPHTGQKQTYGPYGGLMYTLAWSPSGEAVAVAGIERQIRIIQTRTGETLLSFAGHSNTIRTLAWGPDGRYLASGSLDGTVKLWDAQTGSLLRELKAQGKVRALRFSPDGRGLAAATAAGTAIIWQVESGAEHLRLRAHDAPLWHLDWHPSGQDLATASTDRTGRLWHISHLGYGSAESLGSLSSQVAQLPPTNIRLNLPVAQKRNPYAYALVIGNQHYSAKQPGMTAQQDVPFAQADALLMRRYLQEVLGVPADQILIRLDATSAELRTEIARLSALARAAGPQAELYFYYAGHGVPDAAGVAGLLLPVDVPPAQPTMAVPLNEVLLTLTETPVARLTVWIDACFNGAGREGPALAHRGIGILPKPVQPRGNTVVFAASRGDQPALPFPQAEQGLFTYYLLHALHQTPGRNQGPLTYGQLADELSREVALRALLVHSTPQEPSTIAAPTLGDTWRNWALYSPGSK